FGLLQYAFGGQKLGEAGKYPVAPSSPAAAARLKRRAALFLGGGLLLLGAVAAAIATGILPVTPEQISSAYSYILLAVTVIFFGWLFSSGNWTPDERKRLYLIGVFFLAAALFFSEEHADQIEPLAF